MKLLLLGKSGQVGFELRRALAPLGKVIAIDRTGCDLTDASAIRNLVTHTKPAVIVNAAAYTTVDRAETDSELAYAVNAVAPGVLGEAAAKLGALVIHYSTDYVFDGSRQDPYLESDATNPQSIYGASKLAGELALARSGAKHLIFRTSWVVGAYGSNFAKTMLRLASQRSELKVVSDQLGAPTSASLIADVTAHVICHVLPSVEDRGAFSSYQGTYHLVASGVTNWHAYACHVIDRARDAGQPVTVTPDAVLPIQTKDYPTPAKRPHNSRLDTQKISDTFGLLMPDWRDGVDHILDQLFQK
jgi:dTDP-4-dehydrorhamnose reductase